jgi:hypothetical protein
MERIAARSPAVVFQGPVVRAHCDHAGHTN